MLLLVYKILALTQISFIIKVSSSIFCVTQGRCYSVVCDRQLIWLKGVTIISVAFCIPYHNLGNLIFLLSYCQTKK